MTDGSDVPLASLSSVVELIGGYAISEDLGRKGMGHLFVCRDLDLERDVV